MPGSSTWKPVSLVSAVMCWTCSMAPLMGSPCPSNSASFRASSTAASSPACPRSSAFTTLARQTVCGSSRSICARHQERNRPMRESITVEPDRISREQSYLQHGNTFVDRLRTRLVQREILKHLPKAGNLRVLDLGCGYHAACLKAVGERVAEGVGVDFHIDDETRRHPRLTFITSSIEDALPDLP